MPAPDVEPVERTPEILPLLGRRLYLLALRVRLQFQLRFQFPGTRVPRRQVYLQVQLVYRALYLAGCVANLEEKDQFRDCRLAIRQPQGIRI